jgi:hypothetical protein
MRRIIVMAVAALVILLVFVALWVGIRALAARDELNGALPLVHSLEAAAVSGDSATVESTVRAIQTRTHRAVSLTSDPIWRIAETTPFLGVNLTAVRSSAALTDDIATKVAPPLANVLTVAKVSDLLPKGGAIDLKALAAAGPSIAKARVAMDAAHQAAGRIDLSGTLPPVDTAVSKFLTLADQAATTVDGLNTAVRILPAMLGADGPRHYLLLSLTNSELRSAGGIPGALAVVDADRGALSLGATASIDDLKRFAEPVLPLTDSELTLFDQRLGKWMENVVSTPDFARSGALAQAIWTARRGQTVDGVVAIDPVALGYILTATGPIDGGFGITLNSQNAAPFLLNTVYSRFPDTKDQDIFFAAVTKKIFAAMTGGKLDVRKLVDALGRSASEHRLHVWSGHAAEQKEISGSSLAGGLPRSTVATSAFGVYLNDATGGKMDFYLRSHVAVSSAECRADSRPYLNVSVKLTSTAPLDSATALPSYVTGRYAFGVAPGRTRTNVYVYAPAGAQPYSVQLNGKEYAFVSSTLAGQPMMGAVVEIGPQQSATLTFRLLGSAATPTLTTVATTPMSSPVVLSLGRTVACSDVGP